MEITILLLIFFARVLDVSIGTIRILFISRGMKIVAPLLGFIEVTIWIIAIKNILLNVDGVWGIIAYSGGFAFGTFTGMLIDDKLSMGKVMIRVIARNQRTELIEILKNLCKKVTWTPATGKNGRVVIIFAIVKKKELKNLVKEISKVSPKAFYTIEDVRYAHEENLPKQKYTLGIRKGK